MPEPEVEVEAMDGNQATATGRIDDPVADEEAKRHLREQLRKTLSHKAVDSSGSGTFLPPTYPMLLISLRAPTAFRSR